MPKCQEGGETKRRFVMRLASPAFYQNPGRTSSAVSGSSLLPRFTASRLHAPLTPNSLAAARPSALLQWTGNRRMNDLTTEENRPQRPTPPEEPSQPFRPLRAWPAFLLALLMPAA